MALTFISPLGSHRVTFAISVCISYYSLFCPGIPIHLICLLLVGLFCLFLSFRINKLRPMFISTRDYGLNDNASYQVAIKGRSTLQNNVETTRHDRRRTSRRGCSVRC